MGYVSSQEDIDFAILTWSLVIWCLRVDGWMEMVDDVQLRKEKKKTNLVSQFIVAAGVFFHKSD